MAESASVRLGAVGSPAAGGAPSREGLRADPGASSVGTLRSAFGRPEAALTHAGVRPGSAVSAETVPVLPGLRDVIPGGALRAGSVVGVDGSASLGVALVAGVSGHGGAEGRGGWCGVVGMPDFGVLAAAGMGAEPERLLLVDEPGERWPDVVAALVEAVDLVLLRPPAPPAGAAVRRLSALVRKHGCVLALSGPYERQWPGVQLRLRVAEAEWEGVGDGHGLLSARLARVVADGRGGGRSAWVWLPGPDGTVTAATAVRPALEVAG